MCFEFSLNVKLYLGAVVDDYGLDVLLTLIAGLAFLYSGIFALIGLKIGYVGFALAGLLTYGFDKTIFFLFV